MNQVKCLNKSTTLCLVPKIQNASSIRDYRPIACCSVVYKLISKILTARMQSVVGNVVNCAQAGFIPGRSIADNILLASELIKGYSRKNSSPGCMMKVDLKKAYDSIEWPFLKTMLSELGFPERFTEWIMQCLSTVSYSILVNFLLSLSLLRKGNSRIRVSFPLVERMISRMKSHLRSVMSESGTQRLVSRIIDELCDLGKDHH